MVKKLFFLLLLVPQIATAQKIKLGVSIPFAVKQNIVANKESKYSALGSYGATALLQVNDGTETGLIFQQHIGFWVDRTVYHIDEREERWGIETVSLLINPEVVIPTKYERLKFNIGIGVLVKLFSGYFMGGKGSGVSQGYPNIDSIDRKNSRSIIPLFSLGANYRIRKHLTARLFLTQTLLNYFDKNTTVIYNVPGGVIEKNISYQPTFIGIQAIYLF